MTYRRPGERALDRFWSMGVLTSYGCLEWQAGRLPKGYGRLRVGARRVTASRLALEWKLGRELRPGMFALHTCDNPPCYLPDHLYEGTRSDNERDKWTPERAAYLAAIRATRA